MVELKPCPFCGQPLTITAPVDPIAYCATPDCFIGARGVAFSLRRQKDVTAWNTRAPAL